MSNATECAPLYTRRHGVAPVRGIGLADGCYLAFSGNGLKH